VSGVHGIGVLNLLLAIALVAWEVMAVAGVEINAPKSLVSAALAGGIVLFTILKIIVDSESIAIFAWIGLILALVIGYGGWMRWQEHQASGGGMGGGSTGGTAPPPMPGGPPA
jgi:CDP-diglyceride synthetase